MQSLATDLAERIAVRRGIVYEWSFATPEAKETDAQSPLVATAAAPKTTIMTNRASPFPGLPGLEGRKKQLLRQAVVRIQSKQRLQMVERNKRGYVEPKGQAVIKDIDEMVVIQKVLWDVNGDGPWKIWGTTKATTMENWDEVVNQGAVQEEDPNKGKERNGKGLPST